MTKYVEAFVILVVGVLIGWGVGMCLGSAAAEQGASADLVLLAHVIPSAIIGGLGGWAASLRALS